MPKYRTKPIEVEAEQLQEDILLENPDGSTYPGKKGDYFLTDPGGSTWYCPKEEFNQHYEEVLPEGKTSKKKKVIIPTSTELSQEQIWGGPED